MEPINRAPTSPWHLAAKTGDLDSIKVHVAQGQWIDEPDAKGRSALYLAAKKGHQAVVAFLVGQEAIIYPTFKDKKVKDVAAGPVKQLLTSDLRSLPLQNVLREKLEKADRTIDLLSTIQGLQDPIKYLAYAQTAAHIVFNSYAQALEFVNKIPNDAKGNLWEASLHHYDSPFLKCNTAAIIASMLITFGNCEEAKKFAALIPQGDRLRAQVDMEIKLGDEILINIDTMASGDSSIFRKALEGTLDGVHGKHKRPENMPTILEEMIATKTFRAASVYTDTILDPHTRGYARAMLNFALSFSPLIEIAKDASEKLGETRGEIYTAFEERVKTALENGNFEPVTEALTNVTDTFFRSAMVIQASIQLLETAKQKEAAQTGAGKILIQQVRNLYKLIPDYIDFFNDERQPALEDHLALLRDAGLIEEASRIEMAAKIYA